MTLAELPIGSPGYITQVGGEGSLRLRLLDMGIIPKTLVVVRKAAPMGDPIEIHIRGYELTLRLEDARKISVEPVDMQCGGNCRNCHEHRHRGRRNYEASSDR